MRPLPGRGLRYTVWAAVYLFGIAYLLLLPPWEGYDEIAHYSYAQQLASTGEAPTVAQGRLSQDVERYLTVAPAPYSTTPPFDQNGGLTYRAWFEGLYPREAPHVAPSQPREFTPGQRANWQAQHPLLYYALLAPVVEMTSDLSWAGQLFWLRLVSWTLAFAGFVISLLATDAAVRRALPEAYAGFQRIALIWPLVFPGFFPELARLGNDALVLLLLGLVWALALQPVSARRSYLWYLAMGLLLGLGALVKVTFLPVAVALSAWLGWLAIRAHDSGERRRGVLGVLLVGVVFLAFASYWYLGNLLERGSLTGLVELSEAGPQPSWLTALAQPIEIIRGLLGMALTFVWGGSTSSAYPPVIAVLPLLLPPVALLVGALGRRHAWLLLAWLMLGAVAGGLLYYLLVRIAVTGIGAGAPGWYLHTLVGPLSLLLAVGWSRWAQWAPRVVTLVGRLWVAYAACLVLALIWLQVSLFTGCSFKTATRRFYSFDDPACLFDFAQLNARLGELAFPAAGSLAALLALILLAIAWFSRPRKAVG